MRISLLLKDITRVIGLGNVPIPVAGRTQAIPLVWGGESTRCFLTVVPTLQNFDVILGMDVMTALTTNDIQHSQQWHHRVSRPL